MSWETDWIKQYPCPCGKSVYEEESRSDDWNRHKSIYRMLCEECREKYFYSHEILGGHKGNFIEKGWILKGD
ncbi:hypothetical protein [Brassicibacter mesophilus]|uniref:hypothetical protein n=1 Tax=Brassicibacter mesophilus TaxID=745119 RepID=UPI003D19A7F5